ncbi:hypothetical protein PINS_up019989, partial [Pythium insidiosum]
ARPPWTGDRRRRPQRRSASLEQQVFHKSEELVAQCEKNVQLVERFDRQRLELHELKREVAVARSALLKAMMGRRRGRGRVPKRPAG